MNETRQPRINFLKRFTLHKIRYDIVYHSANNNESNSAILMTEYRQPRTTPAEATMHETTVRQHQYVTCSHVVKGWGDDLAGTPTEPVTLCTPPWHVLREALYGVVQSTIHNAHTQNHHPPNSNNTMLLRTFDTDDAPSVDVAYVMVVGASARTKRKGNNGGRGKRACTLTTSENTNYPSTDPYVNGISVPKFRLLMDENDMVHHTDVHNNNNNAVYTTDPQPILAAHDPWNDNQKTATNDDQQDSLVSTDRMIVTNDHPILSLEKSPDEYTIAAVDQGLANIRVTTCTILGGDDLDSIDAPNPSATAPMDMTNELQESPKTSTTTTTIVCAEAVPEPIPHPRFRLLVD
jgi:hypothetical protein